MATNLHNLACAECGTRGRDGQNIEYDDPTVSTGISTRFVCQSCLDYASDVANTDDMIDGLVVAVKKYATEHYNTNGWDIIVEAWTGAELAEVIREEKCTTVAEAVKAIGFYAELQDERRRDIRATEW